MKKILNRMKISGSKYPRITAQFDYAIFLLETKNPRLLDKEVKLVRKTQVNREFSIEKTCNLYSICRHTTKSNKSLLVE